MGRKIVKGMRIRGVATVVLVGVLTLGGTISASASTASQRANARYALALKTWKVTDQTYLAKRRAVNVAYTIAVNLAQSNFTAAKSAATTSAERITARTTFRLAIAEATSTRALALMNLGSAPVKPVKPS
jgi:hypothetical protein